MAEPRRNNGRRRVSRGSNPVEPLTLEQKIRLVLKADVSIERLDDVVRETMVIIVVANSATTEPSGAPSPAELSVADLEKQIKDLKHDLAAAEGRAKNALSDLQYWRGQYETATAPAPAEREAEE